MIFHLNLFKLVEFFYTNSFTTERTRTKMWFQTRSNYCNKVRVCITVFGWDEKNILTLKHIVLFLHGLQRHDRSIVWGPGPDTRVRYFFLYLVKHWYGIGLTWNCTVVRLFPATSPPMHFSFCSHMTGIFQLYCASLVL